MISDLIEISATWSAQARSEAREDDLISAIVTPGSTGNSFTEEEGSPTRR